MNSRTTPNPNGIKYIAGSSKTNWKYTDNANDSDCATNWNYYDKDGKTLILGSIPNITKERSDRNWCALKPPPPIKAPNPNGINYIAGSSKTNWKYTDNANDSDCATNWNYYDKDGKTLILGNIPNITKERSDRNWCALKTPSSPPPTTPTPSSRPPTTPTPSSPPPTTPTPSSPPPTTPTPEPQSPSSENTPPSSSEDTTSSSGNTMLYVIIGIILLLIIVGVVFFKLKKKKTDPMTAFGNRLKKMCKKF